MLKKTKYDFGDLRIVIDEPVKDYLLAKDKPYFIDEVHRLIESFGNKLLMTKAEGPIDFTNKTSGVNIQLDMQWESDDSAVVYVREVVLEGRKEAAAV